MKQPSPPLYAEPQHARGRLWGLDIITAGYALGAALCAYLVFAGGPLAKWTGFIGGPVCVLASCGVAFRVNKVRLAMIAIFGIASIVAVLSAVLKTMHKKPIDMMQLAVQSALSVVLVVYLLRREVRDAFTRKSGG